MQLAGVGTWMDRVRSPLAHHGAADKDKCIWQLTIYKNKVLYCILGFSPSKEVLNCQNLDPRYLISLIN
jgi:hypothetical protein